MCKVLGIEHSQTSAYHLQGNGQVERFNQTMEEILGKVVQANQEDWDKYLPKVLFAYVEQQFMNQPSSHHFI